MALSIHDSHDEPRNANIRIWVKGVLKPRSEPVVSVFDSGFALGDGVWKGLRRTAISNALLPYPVHPKPAALHADMAHALGRSSQAHN